MKLQLAQLSLLLHGAAAQWQAKVPLETRSLDEIYAAAKKEAGNNSQPLQVAWGGDAGTQGDGVRKAWKERFPDIPLNLTVDLSKYHDGRIDTAFYKGGHVADVAFLQTLQNFPRWKAQNRLLYYKPAEFDDIFDGEKDLDGAWLGAFNFGFGKIAWDSTKLNDSDVPTTYESFSDPFWKSKLVLTYPNDDDAIAYLFSLIIAKYGHSWLQALAANDVQWVRGSATAQLEITRLHNSTNSSRALTFTSSPGSAAWWKTSTPNEQYVSWAQTGAIIASTTKPEAAKLFMSWITNKEGGQAGRSSTQFALQTDATNPLLSNSTKLSGFRQFEQDRATVEWWKNQFEDALGTPQGLSPLEVYPNPPYEG